MKEDISLKRNMKAWNIDHLSNQPTGIEIIRRQQ
jgi:hypothetical protein